MGRKTTVWILQAINEEDCIQEDLSMTEKGESQGRNLISSNNNTK